MIQAGLYNLDCMDAMKEFPDKFFDLALVDPPYGGGSKASLSVTDGTAPDSAVGLTSIISADRTGGTWASKYRQRTKGQTSDAGMLPRHQSIFKNLQEYQGTKLYGAATTLDFHRHGVSSFGES